MMGSGFGAALERQMACGILVLCAACIAIGAIGWRVIAWLLAHVRWV